MSLLYKECLNISRPKKGHKSIGKWAKTMDNKFSSEEIQNDPKSIKNILKKKMFSILSIKQVDIPEEPSYHFCIKDWKH